MIQRYNLNLVPMGQGVYVRCSQYDKNLRIIEMTLYNGNAVFNIPEGSVVTVRGTKPRDNTGFEYECTYLGSTVSFEIQDQMTVYAGKLPAEIRITKDGAILGSANFCFNVEPAPLTDDTVISETQLPLLEQALQASESARESMLNAQGYAQDASDSATAADESEANALTYSQNAQTSANSASQSEANALTYAQNASESASEAQGFAQDAEDSATQSADSATSASQSATQAQTIADNIADLVDEAQGYASQSLTNAQNSAQSASQASQSATNASQSETNAQNYASNASDSATTASESELNALTYSQNARSSANSASQSEANALTYSQNASASATQAQGYATNASDSATASADSATESQGYAQNASDSASEAQELVDTVEERIANKADIDGVYPKLVAGDLVESETKDDVFTYQVTDHTGKANINSIKGNTIVWNQLVQVSDIRSRTINGLTFVSNNDGSVSVTGTCTSTDVYSMLQVGISTIVGHIYYFHGIVSTSDYGIAISTGLLSPVGTDGQIRSVSSTVSNVNLYVKQGATLDIKVYPQANDLTQMFGAGNEPTSVAEFTKLYPLPYYQYNAGELLSFNGTGIKTVGFNQWDEEWEDGDINITTGQNQEDSSYWRSTNYIPVLPNKQYYVYVVDSTASTSIRVRLYGSDKQYIGSTINGNYVVPNVVFTVPNDVYFIRFAPSKSIYPTGSQFCINISSSRNGEYEPYKEETLLLPIAQYFPNGMRSAGSVYDELTNSKATIRIIDVNLGTLNWVYRNDEHSYFSSTGIQGAVVPPSAGNVKPNVLCAIYGTTTPNNLYDHIADKTITIGTQGQIWVYDTSYTDATAFKTAMNNIHLLYETSSPTEVDVDLDLSYSTYEGGTEQLLPANTDVPVTSPISMNVEFDFGENLNARFTKVLNMIAPVESAQVSQAYTAGQYLIYDYTLYKVTSNIASGGTITVGTNVTATTLAEILEAL